MPGSEIGVVFAPFFLALVIFLALVDRDKARAGRDLRRRLDLAVAEEYQLLVELDRVRDALWLVEEGG